MIAPVPALLRRGPGDRRLRVLDVNALSPLAALNNLYELQQRVRG